MLTLYFFFCILQIVGLTLIIVPVSFKISAVLTSWPIVGGTISCGVFLMLLSIAGIYGAIKHHQIILFFVSFVEISLPLPKINCSLEKRKNRKLSITAIKVQLLFVAMAISSKLYIHISKTESWAGQSNLSVVSAT